MYGSTIDPGTAPDGLFLVIQTDSGTVLRAIPLDFTRGPAEHALEDMLPAMNWLGAHPDDVVRMHVYDGDDGICLKTIVIPGADSAEQPEDHEHECGPEQQ
jgi:hypothetical protein